MSSSIGSIEPQFNAELLSKLEIDPAELPHQMDARHWPALQERFSAIFRTRSRDEWCALMEGSDICFAPVLGFDEVRGHAHARARGTYYEDGEVWQPAPAPRFSRSRPEHPTTPAAAGADTDAVLAEHGYDEATRQRLRAEGSIG